MNNEICKNCDKKCFILFVGKERRHLLCKNLDEASIEQRAFLISDKVFYHGDDGVWTVIKEAKKVYKYLSKEKDFINVEVDNNCPYYAEHELYGWNKKK